MPKERDGFQWRCRKLIARKRRERTRESRGLRHSRRRHAGRVVMQIVELVECERGTSRRGEEDEKARTNHRVVVEDIWQPRNT